MLEIRNFSLSYDGRKKAVDNLTLSVSAGDIYGFIGHNGAGKTTTIRAMTGVIDFTEGDILIDGHSIKGDPLSCKRAMAYVPDNPDLYDFMTGIQYIDYICDIYEVEKSEREAALADLAGRFELTANLGDLITSYSHGMRQKLALIAALIHRPRLMVFDEPFVGLDPKAVHTIKTIMAERCAQGCAVFFSTHVLEVAEKLCNRIGIIKGGKLISSGPMDEVKGDQSLEAVFLELIEE